MKSVDNTVIHNGKIYTKVSYTHYIDVYRSTDGDLIIVDKIPGI